MTGVKNDTMLNERLVKWQVLQMTRFQMTGGTNDTLPIGRGDKLYAAKWKV